MKRLLNAFGIAFSMYSVIPMPRVDWSKDNMRYAFCFFPLVGAVIGGAVWGWLLLCGALGLGELLTAAGCTAIPVLLSGGIHMDGFCDTLDALASHAPMERKLEILKDSGAGAFAVMGCCLYMLLSFGLWAQLPKRPELIGIVALGFVLSRTLSGLSVIGLRRARRNGLAATFADAADNPVAVRVALIVLISPCSFMMADLSFAAGCGALAAALAAFVYYWRTAYRNFGGVTGDLAGYFLQLCELGILAAVALIGSAAF